MTRKIEYRLGGLALLIAFCCILGMQAPIQDFGISLIGSLVPSGSSLAKYFTPERMKQYFTRCVSVLLQLEIICVLLYVVWRKMKDRAKILQGELAPFVLLAVGSFLLHVFLILNWGDDVFFRDSIQPENVTLFSFLGERYFVWSSRLIIEAIVIIVTHVPIIWWFLDTAILVLAAYSLHVLLPPMNKKANYLLVCLIFIYPFIDMRTAGWIATTMNYIWPLSLGLYALISIKRILHGEPMKIYHYVLSVLALLYAANHEQMGTILAGFFVLFSIYQIIVQKKVHWFLVLQAVLSMLTLELPMHIEATNWFDGAAVIERGPLIYALKMDEKWEKKEMEPERVRAYGEWYYEVTSDTPWNYALTNSQLRPDVINEHFEVKKLDVIADYPWTLENAPITIIGKGRPIPTWKEYRGSAGSVPFFTQQGPDTTDEVEIELIPFGCTTLRITEFPVRN